MYIIFLFLCWGGCVSDRQIIIELGIFDKFFLGDVVFVDWGFNMIEDFVLKGVQLIVLVYIKGKSQLLKEDVEKFCMMFCVWIYIE